LEKREGIGCVFHISCGKGSDIRFIFVAFTTKKLLISFKKHPILASLLNNKNNKHQTP